MIDAFTEMLLKGNALQQQESPNPVLTPGAAGGAMSGVHKGLFGLKGLPRDILGVIGDALLNANRLEPIYTPARQAEGIGDALGLMGNNPEEAIRRISAINPALGQKYSDDWMRSKTEKARLQQSQQIADRNYQFGVQKDQTDQYEKIAPSVYGMIGTATEKTWPSIVAKARAIEKRYGVKLPYELSDAWDPTTASSYNELAVNPTARAQIAATDRRSAAQLEISRGNLGVSRGNLAVREGEAGEKKRVGQYTGEDGKVRIIWDDGTETVSQSKEQPRATGGSGRPRPGGAAPASGNGPPPPRKVGDKIRAPDGTILVSKDGKTWSK